MFHTKVNTIARRLRSKLNSHTWILELKTSQACSRMFTLVKLMFWAYNVIRDVGMQIFNDLFALASRYGGENEREIIGHASINVLIILS